ncbi:acyl-CoA thioesterase/bile acid-CoA:amino acid N-acyltransferase family protein [Sporosarcina highlanderae]|uniref:Acyl-CoA thioesterase/bile acid-CoA:amino acid N-acyltransferase family protein n=1 Tax=Sporosarcina highlanderae TaxID=3035916 RepID=A0ABT8JPE1_9BACL|nr:acyl-CoA thioesterase/bile acid-CoA:amino acid N-acyltransferase family protein [Sporosarcina highlanderae]MDN4607001.1 acyl-CoA thioesterase/bile acid-CoA:amino acid N-acyltransferase family protein [Sporosarcina highlanderae]
MKPTFQITQNNSLIDTKMEILITNLPPCGIVTLKAEMCDNLGMTWESFAEFMSDDEGEINLANAKPISGTYSTPDVMGLFWSMKPIPNDKPKAKTPLKPLKTKLTLMREQEALAATSIIRDVVSPVVDRFTIRECGLVGTFFCHTKNVPLPTIIVLGGSEGGLRENNAALLASYGFNTLALAYFGIEGLPKELVTIPLDYIEKAIEWLRNNPNVDFTKLGVLGTSKGGELALLSASLFPEIKAVVGYVPSGVVYPGIGQSALGKSSWQYRGESLPFAYGEIPKEVTLEINQARDVGEPISWRKTYQWWAEGEKQAEIAVENIKGPVLLISGGDDQLWPADLLSEKVIDRLKEHNHAYHYEHINFPKAGHSFSVPGYPTTQSVVSPFGNGKLSLGGTPKENSHAQFEAWENVKDFFITYLA